MNSVLLKKKNKPKIRIKFKHNNILKKEILLNFYRSIISKKIKIIISQQDLFYLMKICFKLVESQKKNKLIKI